MTDALLIPHRNVGLLSNSWSKVPDKVSTQVVNKESLTPFQHMQKWNDLVRMQRDSFGAISGLVDLGYAFSYSNNATGGTHFIPYNISGQRYQRTFR